MHAARTAMVARASNSASSAAHASSGHHRGSSGGGSVGYRESSSSSSLQSARDDSVHASALIESLAAEQNGYLLMLLEKEQANEAERVRLLASITDPGDARRLEKIFAVERAKAASVLKAVTKEHERALAIRMQELGVIEDDDDDEFMRPQPHERQQQQQQRR